LAHHDVVDYCGNEEYDHEDDGPGGGVDGEEADEADFGKVDACHELLKGFGVRSAFGVDVVGKDIEGVVPDGEVDEEESDGSKAKDKRGDDGVGDC